MLSRAQYKRAVLKIGVLIISLFPAGCKQPVITKDLAPAIPLGTTIGSLVEVFSPETIGVEGYGLVGGLAGTGSGECPPHIRDYLEKYILRQLPEQKTDVDKIISSPSTAVVVVRGMMPTSGPGKQHFDVRVDVLVGTQTTSLEGGQLYGAELKAAGTFAVSLKVLANVNGPVFIDTIDAAPPDKRTGYVLGGGRGVEDYKVSLALHRPDYRTANAIRNRLNTRYGHDIAKAVANSLIELKVPPKYKGQKQRFIRLVKAMFLQENPQLIEEKISTFVRKLAVSDEKAQSEIALEAIGMQSLGKLSALVNSSSDEVRFRAARCMLNLGSDVGLDVLRETASDKSSGYRIAALDAITVSASYSDASVLLRRTLRDDDFAIVSAAYENLRKLDDISIMRDLIAGDFYLEQITQTKSKTIYVSRSGRPRIVLFGAPIYCRYNSFVQSSDGNITINAPAGEKYVSIIRKHPKHPDVIIQLKSSFELGHIIRTLCEEPLKRFDEQQIGLGVSYADVIALLKRMCDRGAVSAQFRAGPLPKIDPIVKTKQPIGR